MAGIGIGPFGVFKTLRGGDKGFLSVVFARAPFDADNGAPCCGFVNRFFALAMTCSIMALCAEDGEEVCCRGGYLVVSSGDSVQ